MMKKIGIIGAMELEVEALKGKMSVRRTEEKASMKFLEGTLNGTEAVIVQSGIGKVNAAVCAQILCDTFQVSHIINTGVAGSLKNEINIGDIVVSSDALHHDVDVRCCRLSLVIGILVVRNHCHLFRGCPGFNGCVQVIHGLIW